jgi:serine/threonine protein kinase
MPAPSTTDEFLALVSKSDLITASRLEEYLDRQQSEGVLAETPLKAALDLIQEGLLTKYQAEQLLAGRWRNFTIGGKYKLLERLGKGGMALVFLCEHRVMKRLVALKILPTAHNSDKELLGRFHREARALSALRHPNIVGAYDADQANQVHFLVMEYVDGGDLEQIVQRTGPLAWDRAADYIRQASLGLQHADECGLVHRDVKPGNVLVDRAGTVKLLDLGLARIFHESTDDLTTGRDAKTLLGTVDYLAPEQALNSHDVDIRADIYGLGATFYYVLTGKGLFEDGTIAQKLSWHLHRPPVPIASVRSDVPDGLIQVIERMLAKRPEDRYQTPGEVVEALEPWTRTPLDPPDPRCFPPLSRAARSLGPLSMTRTNFSSNRTPVRNVASEPAVPSHSKSVVEEVAPVAEVTNPGSGKLLPRHRSRPRLLAASLVFGIIAASVGGWLAFSGAGDVSPDASTRTSPLAGMNRSASSDPAKPTEVVELPPPPGQPGDVTIELASESKPTQRFASLRRAVLAAKAGDRVVVTGSLLVDTLELSDVEGIPANLTIEGVAPGRAGRLVRWRAAPGSIASRHLLDVAGLEGFHLKGFLLDGEGRIADLARFSGRAAGGSIEDAQFEGATRAGIVLRGWAGGSEHPATIRKVRFSTKTESESAIRFEVDPDRPTSASESIRILGCRFEGPFLSALSLGGPVERLDVEQCRFYRPTDAIRYRRSEAREPLVLNVSHNTFVSLQRGLHFETTPLAASSELLVSNNLFVDTARIATLDRVSVEPNNIAARWIWVDEGNKGSPTVPPGAREFRKVFEVETRPTKATLDISCDETFVVWLNGTEVFKNASPHYTQRVFGIDVTRHLRTGKNVLAVQGTNLPDRLDARFGTTAGLLAQVTTTGETGDAVLAKTDETWKCHERSSDGWIMPGFDDRAWAPARVWQEDRVTCPWKFAVWDSVVTAQLKPPLEPIRVKASGNARDYKSWEGYPVVDSERLVIPEDLLPKSPGDDASFLRYKANHPLGTAGPGGTPLGAFDRR